MGALLQKNHRRQGDSSLAVIECSTESFFDSMKSIIHFWTQGQRTVIKQWVFSEIRISTFLQQCEEGGGCKKIRKKYFPSLDGNNSDFPFQVPHLISHIIFSKRTYTHGFFPRSESPLDKWQLIIKCHNILALRAPVLSLQNVFFFFFCCSSPLKIGLTIRAMSAGHPGIRKKKQPLNWKVNLTKWNPPLPTEA